MRRNLLLTLLLSVVVAAILASISSARATTNAVAIAPNAVLTGSASAGTLPRPPVTRATVPPATAAAVRPAVHPTTTTRAPARPAAPPTTRAAAPVHASAPATTAVTATPATSAAPPTTAPSGGCSAALTYLAAHSAPGFTFQCPGYALGHQAMTCINVPGVCSGQKLIVISVACPASWMNEASNSWVLSGLANRPIDPYGYCS